MAKPKKFFIRLDGKGRTVAGSGVWRATRPKTGRWLEIEGDQCCGETTSTTTTTTTTT